MTMLADTPDPRTLPAPTPEDIAAEVSEASEDIAAIQDGVPAHDPRISETLPALPTNRHGVLDKAFWRYYKPPWTPIFWDWHDPYNDLVTICWGPRGGGKTITGTSISIIDGQMRGIPVISNVPFAWIAKDETGKLYRVESLPFDQEAFARGDHGLKYKRLLIDEGNYLADRLRSTSTKNLQMTDILQQARKFRMCVIFATINWMWLDPRVTGSLCDLLIECNDLYYKSYGRHHGVAKGHRITWDIMDQSGKISGRQFHPLCKTTFNARLMWYTYNTESFVNPLEARRKLFQDSKLIRDDFGNLVSIQAWYANLRQKVQALSRTKPVWDGNELWESLGIEDHGLRVRAGQYLRGKMGIEKDRDRAGFATYDLSGLVDSGAS